MDIKDFGAHIQQLIAGRDLDGDTAYAMFCDVLKNEQPDLQQRYALSKAGSRRFLVL